MDIRFTFRYKLQFQVFFGGMIINTEVPDFHKSCRQDMQGKTSQELHPVHGNRFFDSPVTIIFGNESHLSSGNIQDPLVGDGYPMGVLSPGMQDSHGTAFHPRNVCIRITGSFVSFFSEDKTIAFLFIPSKR